MHLKVQKVTGPRTVPVRFVLEDPASLGLDDDKTEIEVMAAIGQNILEVAMENGIHIEHTCGGVCACSTCHVYIDEGEACFDEPEDEELDRVDEAPGVELNSRLSCQAVVKREGNIVVRVPMWNRNAVKEVPH
jgi:2Fe-2S ferredoxin